MNRLLKPASLFISILPLTLQPALANEECVFRKIETRGWYGGKGIERMDLRPAYATHSVGTRTAAELYGTLLLQANTEIVPYLAKDVSFDETTNELTLTLNNNCKWSDGEPITSQDFITGAEVLYATDWDAPSLGFVENGMAVKKGLMPFEKLGISAPDENTLVYKLAHSPELAQYVLSLSSYAPLPHHALEADPNYWERPLNEMLYSGPYRVTGTVENKGIALEKNPYFCTDRPVLVDKVEILYGEDFEDHADQLLKGNADLIGDLPVRIRHNILKDGPPENYTVFASKRPSVMWLTLNSKRPEFDDPRVREAILLAYDKDIIDSGFIGSLSGAGDTLTFRTPYYDPPKFPWYEGSYADAVAKAQGLMEEAGYGADNRLKLTMIGVPASEYESLAAYFESILSQIYIDVNVASLTWEEHIKLLESPNPEYHLRTYYWYGDTPDPSNFIDAIINKHYHSDAITEELTSLFKTANESARDERLAIMSQIEELLIDDGYILPIGIPDDAWLYRKGISFGDAIYPTARDLVEFACVEP